MENAAAHRIKKRAVKLPSFSLGMLEWPNATLLEIDIRSALPSRAPKELGT